MITLNDYLYSGDTVLKILQKYTRDLRKEAKLTHNEIDLMHVRRSGNFINIWLMNIRFLRLHLKEGSNR